MTMIVNGQQLASMTSLFLEKNHGNLARGINRLSSGIRFASSADDAGNLAVSIKLNSSLKRSFAIHKNVQNARSFLSMQEDAYKGLGKIVDRMAELRTIFNDPIKNWGDKVNLNLEFKELQQEVLQMSRAKLNGVSLFSTEDQSKLPFALPTDGSGSHMQITRTGLFNSLTLMAQGAPSGVISHTPTLINDAGANYLAEPPVQIYDSTGLPIAAVDPTNVTLDPIGTLDIDLTSLPAAVTAAGVGTYTVKADDGTVYLDPADVTAASGNQGSDYAALPSGVTITSPSGATVTGDPSTGALTVDGVSFAFAMSAAPNDDKFSIAVSGAPLVTVPAGNFTIKINDGPLTPDNLLLNGGSGYDATAKPIVRIKNSGGTELAQVTPGAVTVKGDGTIDVSFATLPAALTAAGAGDYTVKADNAIYLDPAKTTTKDVGSGYTSVPTSATITGPGGVPVTADPSTGAITVDGVTFAFAMQSAPDDVDKITVTATGTPTATGNFSIAIGGGPLTPSFTTLNVGTGYNNITSVMPEPIVRIKNSGGTEIDQVDPGAVTVKADGTIDVSLATLPAGITTTGTGFTVTADVAIYLDPAQTTTKDLGSGYTSVPTSATITGPGGVPVTADPSTGAITVEGVTFAFAMQSAPDDVDKVTVTATGTPTAEGNFSIAVAAGALTSSETSVNVGAGYDATAKPIVRIKNSGGTELDQVAPGNVAVKADGTIDVSLTALPAGVTTTGTDFTVTADDTFYLDPAQTTSKDLGSGFTSVPTSATITGPGGVPVTADPSAGAITVDGVTFAFAMQSAPDDVDKVTVTATGTPTATGNFSIAVAAGALNSSETSVNVGAGYDATAKPIVRIKNSGGTELDQVAPGNVTVKADGTIDVSLTALPAGVTTTGTDFTVTADDTFYLDPAQTTSKDLGSGFTSVPASATITGPGGVPVTADPSAGAITVDGVTFAFAMQTTPDDVDKVTVTATGTPTATGNFSITVAAGALTSSKASVNVGTGYDQDHVNVMAKPIVRIKDSGGTEVGQITPANVTVQADGTIDVSLASLPAGITATGTGFTVTADDAYKLSSTTFTAGSGYAALPSTVTIQGPSGAAAVSGDPSAGAIGPTDGVSIQSVVLNGDKLDVTLAGIPTQAGNFTISFADGPAQGAATGSASSISGTSTAATGSVTTSAVTGGATDAKELWNTGPPNNSPAITGQDVDTRPVVDGSGNVYFVSSAANYSTLVHKVDANGKEVWTVPNGGPVGPAANVNRKVESNPILSPTGLQLVVPVSSPSTHPQLIAYNVSNGLEMWRHQDTTADATTTPVYSNDGSTVYFGSLDNNLHAVHAVDNVGLGISAGDLKWSFDTGSTGPGGDVRSGPVVDSSGVIYFGSDANGVVSGGGSVFAIRDDTTTGTQIWRKDTYGNVRSTPALSNDETTLYVGDEMAFYAIDTTPGVTRGTDNWGDMTFPTGGASPIQTTVAVGPNDNIYFGANNRTLYAYQDNGASGTELGTFQTGSGGTDNFGRCSPVVNTANRVFFASGDGNAYALDGTDPANWGTAATPGTALEWVGDLNGASKSTPALSADGSIAYVGSDDNKLYAFTDPATGFQLDNTSVTFAKDYLQGTDTLAAGDISLTGTAATGISVSGAPVINANGTVTVTLAGTATSAGTITIATTKAGLPHLAAIPNLGTGYPTTMTAPEIAALGVAITPDASGGSPGVAGTLAGTVTGVNGDGSLNLTFAGTATIGGDFTITVDAGPAEGTAGDQAVSVTTATTVTVGTFDVTQTGAINKTLTNVALKGTTTTPEKFNVTQAGAINQTLTNIALKGTTVTPEKFNVTQTGAIAQTLTNLALKGSTPTPGTFNVTQAGAVSQTLTNLAVQGSMPTPLSLKLTQGTASDVNVAAIQGSMSPQTLTVTDSGTVVETEGLLNEDLDLWDFTVSDFTRYIQVVANVMAVNGAETSSLAFSQSLLRNNFENLELATSRITDTDVAHEMAQLAKNRIKTSTAADMLAKHNKLGMMVDLTVMNLA